MSQKRGIGKLKKLGMKEKELLVVLVETKLVKLATEGHYLIKEEDIECNIPGLLKYYNLFSKVEIKKLQPYFDKNGFKQLEAVATHVKLAGEPKQRKRVRFQLPQEVHDNNLSTDGGSNLEDNNNFSDDVPAKKAKASKSTVGQKKANQQPDAPDVCSDSVVVANVPSLLSFNDDKMHCKRYDITAGEIRRRVGSPEHLSKTCLNEYLRVGRSGNKGEEVMKQCAASSKKRASHFSLLSKICEDEAAALAENVHQINQEFFPVSKIASCLGKDCWSKEPSGDHQASCSKALTEVEAARLYITKISKVLASKMLVKNYEQVTHGFGISNILGVMNLLESILRESECSLRYPDPNLMRSCKCGQPKLLDPESLQLGCQSMDGSIDHDLPTQVQKGTEYRNLSAWKPFLKEQ